MTYGSGIYKDETGIIAKVLTLRYSKKPTKSIQQLSRAIFLTKQQTAKEIFKDMDNLLEDAQDSWTTLDMEEYEKLKARFLPRLKSGVSSSPAAALSHQM